MKYVLLMVLVYSTGASAQIIHDQSFEDRSFSAFRTQLAAAVANQDLNALRPLLGDTVRSGPYVCGSCTTEAFLEEHFSPTEAEETWVQMDLALTYGFGRVLPGPHQYIGFYERETFLAPSYLLRSDYEQNVIILAENVNIRARPSIEAPVVRRASFEKFDCDCGPAIMKKSSRHRADGYDWLEVYLPEGGVGYVVTKFTSDVLYRRIEVARVNGAWRVVGFWTPLTC